MPYSLLVGKNTIKEWFEKQTGFKTIVDLGPGSGNFPRLLGKKKYIWKAVEIWGPYIKRFNLDKLYQEIRIGDIRYMELPKGDCAILGDILEHLNSEDMKRVFKKVDKQYNHVVISIPVRSVGYRCFEGNEFETHLASWSLEGLNKLIPETYKIRKYFEGKGTVKLLAGKKVFKKNQFYRVAVFIK